MANPNPAQYADRHAAAINNITHISQWLGICLFNSVPKGLYHFNDVNITTVV